MMVRQLGENMTKSEHLSSAARQHLILGMARAFARGTAKEGRAGRQQQCDREDKKEI
jgi:hypothetical protein